MASFSAELEVAGALYPVRSCTYDFTQTTSERGRVVAKVRHGLVRLTLDVPDASTLLDWAATAHKPLAGRIIFRNAQGGVVLETLAWEDGECVGYQEEFLSGDAEQGAYVCHLTIATPKLTMQPGGPATYVSPAAGEHDSAAAPVATVLETAVLRAEELASGLVKKVITPAGELGTEILGVGAATIVRAASLTVGLVLTPTNSRDDDGYKSEWDLGKLTQNPTEKDRARLDYLETEREGRALSDAEEDELASLLAVVRKVFVGGRAGLPAYYTQRQSLIALAAKLKRPNDVHSINTIDSKTRFGGGNRNTSKTIAMGQVDLAADFAAIQAGDAVYDKQTQTFLTTSGRVYGYHTDEVGGGNTSAIYPIRSSAGDFVNVTQAEFDILRKMPSNGGLNGPALLELEGKIRAKNGGVTTDTAAKLIKLFNSKKK